MTNTSVDMTIFYAENFIEKIFSRNGQGQEEFFCCLLGVETAPEVCQIYRHPVYVRGPNNNRIVIILR